MKNKIISLFVVVVIGFGGFYGFKKYDKFRLDVPVSSFNHVDVEYSNHNERRLYKNRNKYDPAFGEKCLIPSSDFKIDVVVPLVEKDIETAILTIKSVKDLVSHEIGNIYIVAPNSEVIKNFAKSNDCIWVDEKKVIPFDKLKKYGGWVIQQFLKLSADKFVKNEHFLVIDADTFFLRPVVFMTKGKKNEDMYLINVHWDTCPKRKKFSAHIFGNKKVLRYDFVPHNMFFSKKILSSMKKFIEKKYDKNWTDALLYEMENYPNGPNAFSEYDIYMTYFTKIYKGNESKRFISNANITVPRNRIGGIQSIITAFAPYYKSISMHAKTSFGCVETFNRKDF